MRRAPIYILLSLVVALSCKRGGEASVAPRTGRWHMLLDLGDPKLPFTFDLETAAGTTPVAHIHNGTENILVRDVHLKSDSIFIRMPLFDSEFKGRLTSDSTITGSWYNYVKGPNYKIPFAAKLSNVPRFGVEPNPTVDVTGSWRTVFSAGTPDAYHAIGLFQQAVNGGVSGTFMTETGDYRFLEGGTYQDSLFLSCFDGSHAFLFKAALRNDTLRGLYFSGTHWQEPWFAVRDPGYSLRDPDSLTMLREGYELVDFRFQDTDGNWVSRADKRFEGKPMMVQVMGSWCPNCVDEARLLNEVNAKYHSAGLEILAIGFEKYDDEARAKAALTRFKDQLGIEYPVLYGGPASKDEASARLPFLDHLMSYPTCIFIDRAGVVRRIRTGFYGPSTGEHYDHYKRNLDAFIETLLAEPAPVKASQ